MLYTAEHPALAALKIRVHLDLPPELHPTDYVLMQIDTEALAVEECRLRRRP